MKIAYIYLPGRIQKLELAKNNRCPSDFFYGAIELKKMGHEIGIFEAVERPRKNLLKFLAEQLVNIKYLPPKVHIGILDALLPILPKIHNFDIVIGTTSDISLSLGLMRLFGVLKKPVIGIQCGLLNYKQNIIRKKLTHYVLEKIYSMVFGYGELDPVKNFYEINEKSIGVNPFGVDMNFWCHRHRYNKVDSCVLSIGNDARRDFETLLKAARFLPKVRFLLITKIKINQQPPENVRIIRSTWVSNELDDVAIRDLFCRAACVVVPLKPTVQPSGQSVALQAMACEKPVVLTRTEGLWENRNLRDGENIRFVAPGNHQQLGRVLGEILESRELRRRLGGQGRQYVLAHARIEYFARRIEKRCRLLLEGKADVNPGRTREDTGSL